MKKAETEALIRRIATLEKENQELRNKLYWNDLWLQEFKTSLLKSRKLLGKWMSERFGRERYPVGSTRDYLKRWLG